MVLSVAPTAPAASQMTPVVQRGQPVTIVAQQGEVVVRARGRSLQAGAIGQPVLASVDGSRTALMTIVIGPDELQVQVRRLP